MCLERRLDLFKLFIARLPHSVTNQALFALFAKFGEVHSALVSTNNVSGESLGCGFVEMAYQVEAEIAIKALNGSLSGGRSIGVSAAIGKLQS